MIFWLGLGNPRHIATKSQHLWAVPRQIRFWSFLKKSWDWVRPPPPPSLGQNPNFDRKFVSGAPLSEICKGEAVVDLSALEYGPSHQLDLALRPAEDPFLAKKVKVWVGWLKD